MRPLSKPEPVLGLDDLPPDAQRIAREIERATVAIISHEMAFGALTLGNASHDDAARWKEHRAALVQQFSGAGYTASSFSGWSSPMPGDNGLHFAITPRSVA